MRASKAFAVATLAATLASSVALASDEKRELDSHEHGHAKLEMAVEGKVIAIDLDVPGESIVGFEYAAKTDDEKASVAAALDKLSDPSAVFAFTEAAGCTGEAKDVELHQDGDHNAFEAKYAFTCTDISALAGMETKLFTLYPSIDEIDVDYVTPNGQGSAELEADSAGVSF